MEKEKNKIPKQCTVNPNTLARESSNNQANSKSIHSTRTCQTRLKHSQHGETKYKPETSQPKSFKIYKNIDKNN